MNKAREFDQSVLAELKALLGVIGPEPHDFEGVVGTAIEKHIVIGHVEMAVIVDPLRLDPHHRRDERRWKV